MRVAFHTLGCKVNQYETQILKQLFFEKGYEIIQQLSSADIIIINSCTVTLTGDKKTQQFLRKCRRENPGAVLALTGCFPQAFPELASQLPEANIITGNTSRSQLLQAVEKYMQAGERVIDIQPHQKKETFENMQASFFADKTRAFVKIEDGCESYCAYCIIPYARGGVRSKSLQSLKDELQGLAAKGYKEVVLVGINLSRYGSDIGLRLPDAVEAACGVNGIQRVRLGSLEPDLLTEEDFIRLAKQEKLCTQFHLALQSGCDETLKRMGRRYTTEEYFRLAEYIRNHFENPSITTDIMVGFPGETEEEFAQSMAFLQKVKLAKAHVFAYSPRPGTRAADMEGQVEQEQKHRRSQAMIAAAEKCRQEFLLTMAGRRENVLFETEKDGFFEGYTVNYSPVMVQSKQDIKGKILPVEITSVENGICMGRLA